jgi:hypothetical protein
MVCVAQEEPDVHGPQAKVMLVSLKADGEGLLNRWDMSPKPST